MKVKVLSLFAIIAALIVVEFTMSIAGRDTLVLQQIPFLSLPAALVMTVAICVFYAYLIGFIWRTSGWRATIIAASVIVALTCSCFLLFMAMAERSTIEARDITLDFLKNRASYHVSYLGRIDGKSIPTKLPAGTKLILLYSFHPHGRYVYALRMPNEQDIVVELTRGFAESRFFVHGPDVYPVPPGLEKSDAMHEF